MNIVRVKDVRILNSSLVRLESVSCTSITRFQFNQLAAQRWQFLMFLPRSLRLAGRGMQVSRPPIQQHSEPVAWPINPHSPHVPLEWRVSRLPPPPPPRDGQRCLLAVQRELCDNITTFVVVDLELPAYTVWCPTRLSTPSAMLFHN